jgi:hypothetical protein
MANEYIKGLTRLGYSVESGKKHIKIRSDEGRGGLVVASKTPSCPFALKHLMADINRLAKKESKGRL